MTEHDVFKKIFDRKISGVNYHEDLCKYYMFLGMHNYSKMHKKRAIAEFKEYFHISCKYTELTDKIIKVEQNNMKQVIPDSWYNYTRHDVSASEKRNAVKKGLEDWIGWEKATKEMLLRCYNELKEMDALSLASVVCEMIIDEDKEIMQAEKLHTDLADMDYSMFVLKEK